MSKAEYIYQPSQEVLTDVWLKKLECVGEDDREEYGGDMYWLTQGGPSGTTLLELSTDGKRYRYVWWNGGASRGFDTGMGTQPSPRWLNPEGLVYRGKQPLPFSWRA